MNDELKTVWRVAVVTYFMLLPKNLLGDIEESCIKHRPECLASMLLF